MSSSVIAVAFIYQLIRSTPALNEQILLPLLPLRKPNERIARARGGEWPGFD